MFVSPQAAHLGTSLSGQGVGRANPPTEFASMPQLAEFITGKWRHLSERRAVSTIIYQRKVMWGEGKEEKKGARDEERGGKGGEGMEGAELRGIGRAGKELGGKTDEGKEEMCAGKGREGNR